VSHLFVNGQLITEDVFRSGTDYDQTVLKQWHEQKPRIQCACQAYAMRAEMHVRKTPYGHYTLVNNPEHSDKHTPACPYYGEVERSSPGERRPVEKVGDRLVVHIKLFPETGTHTERSRETGNRTGKQTEEQMHRHRLFPSFIFDWYKLAVEQLQGRGKRMTPASVLYHMWHCMSHHRIWIGTEDFYWFGYVPNERFRLPKRRKVVLGWLREREEVIGGERWGIEGMRSCLIRVLVPESHIPRYRVDGKLVALRVNFDYHEPRSIAPVVGWHITEEGWWLHSGAERELLMLLRERKHIILRPIEPSEEWLGYQPDFVLPERSPPVYVDVLDEPDESLEDRSPQRRKKQAEIYRAAARNRVIRYVQWQSGDPVEF
jgi:hypothetical protein